MTKTPDVDALLARLDAWREETAALREIALGCGLQEGIKWGQPCYLSEGRNVVLIHGFKSYCALLFFKGALMRDPHALLVRQTENVQAGRQARFASLAEIDARRTILKAYIEEAVAIERSGAKVGKAAPTSWPEELTLKCAASPDLAAAFAALTPGRQRAYLLHFSGAKQAKTRLGRIEACAPGILAGKGLDD